MLYAIIASEKREHNQHKMKNRHAHTHTHTHQIIIYKLSNIVWATKISFQKVIKRNSCVWAAAIESPTADSNWLIAAHKHGRQRAGTFDQSKWENDDRKRINLLYR